MLFDWLVTGQVVATNPAHAVRAPKHVVKTGKTTVLDADQARTLLDSIDISTLVGLRDRALLALVTYIFGRVSAAVAMDVENIIPRANAGRSACMRKAASAAMPISRRLAFGMTRRVSSSALPTGAPAL